MNSKRKRKEKDSWWQNSLVSYWLLYEKNCIFQLWICMQTPHFTQEKVNNRTKKPTHLLITSSYASSSLLHLKAILKTVLTDLAKNHLAKMSPVTSVLNNYGEKTTTASYLSICTQMLEICCRSTSLLSLPVLQLRSEASTATPTGRWKLLILLWQQFLLLLLQVETTRTERWPMTQSWPINWPANQQPASAMLSRLCTAGLAM